jgi:hypothetical protein
MRVLLPDARHLSPALVAQYETQMTPKAVLQQK